MKIKIICRDQARFEFLSRTAANIDTPADIIGGAHAVDGLSHVINGTTPDILVLDDVASASLDAMEAIGLRAPSMDTVLVTGDVSADFLMRAMRAGVREVIPSSGGSGALQDALNRIVAKRQKQISEPQAEGKVIAFLSCKGGSGATFLAANLAYALAGECGKRVALIDLNLQFGDAAIFVSDAQPPSNVAEVAQQIHRLDASLLCASMFEAAPNFHVLAAPENPAHATDVRREHVQAILQLARKEFDFVVVDVPRSLDAVSVEALDMADTIFPVLQLTLPYVRDGKRLLGIFRSLNYPSSKVRVLVNRFEKGGELTIDDLEQAIHEKVAYQIPNSYQAAAASVNLGIPIVKSSKSNPVSKLLVDIARDFAHSDGQSADSRWYSRLFSRSSH